MNDQKNTDRFNSVNGSSSKIETEKNFTHWKLLEKIKQYERLTKTKEERDKLLELRDKYLKSEEKKPVKRAERNQVFNMSQRAGQSLDKTYGDLVELDRAQDQRDRNTIAKESKALYHRNFSISKQFRETKKNKEKAKTKSMDKENSLV